MVLLRLWVSLYLVPVSFAFRCMQCSGKVFEGSIRLSRSTCCEPTPVICAPHQICLRAFVVSHHSKFFLSGCHTPDDGLVGCDQHVLPNNATVHRCACMDERCQSYFPGTCKAPPTRRTRPRPPAQISTTTSTTTVSTPATTPPADFDLSEVAIHLTTNTTPASILMQIFICLSLFHMYYRFL